jgi:hypothetical protein
MVFQIGHKFQILKASFLLEKKSVFEFVELFPMLLTNLICFLIISELEVG